MLEENARLAEENAALEAGRLSQQERDVYRRMAEARNQEREASLNAAIQLEHQRHQSRMEQLRADYAELAMALTQSRRTLEHASKSLVQVQNTHYRKEKSIELSDIPVSNDGGYVQRPGPQSTSVRPISPRTQELQEYAQAIRELRDQQAR